MHRGEPARASPSVGIARVLRNLARRLDHDAPGVSASILEGLDEMLTVIRIGLPDQLRRSLGCTNAIESLMAVLRTVCRNVKRWRDARVALRWTGTAMLEAEKNFRRLKAHKQLPILRGALLRHQQTLLDNQPVGSIEFSQWRLLHQFQQAPGLSLRGRSLWLVVVNASA